MDRRSFLRVGALGMASIVSACRSAGPRPGATPTSLRVALLSDTHVPADPNDGYRGFKPVENLRTVVGEILEAGPDAVIHCGDAARLEGRAEDYEALKGLLAPLAARVPISIALGNHDDRAQFRKVFAPGPGPAGASVDRHILVHDHPGFRFVVLDSLLHVNKTPGFLGEAQRDWLRGYLSRADERPVVVFVHHTLGDGDGDLLDAERLVRLLEAHRPVKAVFYGHSHRWEFLERGRLKLINLPAVGYNFNDRQPLGWVDARFRPDGMQLTLRAFAGNRAGNGRCYNVDW